MGTGEKVKAAQVEQKKLLLYVVGHVAQKEVRPCLGLGHTGQGPRGDEGEHRSPVVGRATDGGSREVGVSHLKGWCPEPNTAFG